ncbi:MAG: hypothetical protein LIO96_07430 [Lachnospiraceae bacterium]|nr:hypothetical protein [Lachnospiraceae bacterium]
MRKKEHEQEHELRMYAVRTHEVRKQLIPPIFFFVGVGAVILSSVVRRQQALDAGAAEMTTHAIEVDYLTAAVGLDIYENTDELDDSYGDYFYHGADFYEANVEPDFELFDHVGVLVFEGEDQVETVRWTNGDDDVTQDDVAAMAEELTTAYGDYEQDASGVYYWYAAEDGTLGENDEVAWVSCGLNEDGILVIEASMAFSN